MFNWAESQSLFQQMVFCNDDCRINSFFSEVVTILILVDGFLQYTINGMVRQPLKSHNPYFSRWFSAIVEAKKLAQSFLVSQSLFQQMVFCNRHIETVIKIVWKSQSLFQQMVFCNKFNASLVNPKNKSHNPYFSRWFSAI